MHNVDIGKTYGVDLGDIGLPLEVVQDRILGELRAGTAVSRAF